MFGLGPSESFDEQVLEQATAHMLDTLDRASVRASAVVLPGRTLDRIDPVRAMEIFLRLAGEHSEYDELTVVETVEGQKAMAPIVQREKRRARALLV